MFHYLLSDRSLDASTFLDCGYTCCELGWRGIDHEQGVECWTSRGMSIDEGDSMMLQRVPCRLGGPDYNSSNHKTGDAGVFSTAAAAIGTNSGGNAKNRGSPVTEEEEQHEGEEEERNFVDGVETDCPRSITEAIYWRERFKDDDDLDSVSSCSSSGTPTMTSCGYLPKSIYLVGAPSTGKSTLLNALREVFPEDTPAIEEVAREVGAEMKVTAADIMYRPKRCIAFQKKCLLAQYSAEKSMLDKGTTFLSDRSGVDPVVHAFKYCAKDQFRNLKKTREWKYLRSKYTDPKRSLFVVIEPNQFLMVDDNFRTTSSDWSEWLKFSKMFCDTLRELGIPYKVIPADTIDLEERVELVKGWVNEDGDNTAAVNSAVCPSSPVLHTSSSGAGSSGCSFLRRTSATSEFHERAAALLGSFKKEVMRSSGKPENAAQVVIDDAVSTCCSETVAAAPPQGEKDGKPGKLEPSLSFASTQIGSSNGESFEFVDSATAAIKVTDDN